MRLNKTIWMSFILITILSGCLLTGCQKSASRIHSGSETSTSSPQEGDTGKDPASRDYSGYYIADHDFGEAFSDETMTLDSLKVIFHLTLKKNNKYKLYTVEQEVKAAIRE